MKITWREIRLILSRQHPAFQQTKVTLPPKVTKAAMSHATKVRRPYDQDAPRSIP